MSDPLRGMFRRLKLTLGWLVLVAGGVFMLTVVFGDGVWTSERIPWRFQSTSGSYVVIDTKVGSGTCERPGVPAVTETEHVVRIEAFREERIWLFGGVCTGIGVGRC